MQEKKRAGKTSALPELHSSVTEVLVVNGRSFQPFIRTFSYTGENISKSNLGTLVGVFEIDEMSEDSAYIVNFLASVAKKEYFNNPRRGAIESFEAALHKINLALAELVKHGNVTWLGKFHGAIGVLEKNNFHFSVTGQATILLLRNESFSDIAEGLASEESKTHPIKTFVEVSSGRLALEDQIIMASPELLALFTLEDLTKNARRMDHERFAQFLKTALVNELDMSGALIIDVFEEALLPEPKKAKAAAKESSPEHVQNAFSQSTFLKKEQPTPPQETPLLTETREKPAREEYVDTKTGHIYVQGETPGAAPEHPAWEKFLLSLQEASQALGSFMSTQGRLLRKGKKQSLLALASFKDEMVVLGRRGARSLRRLIRKQQASWKKKRATASVTPPQETIAPSITPKPTLPVSDIALPRKESPAPLTPPIQEKELPVKEDLSKSLPEEATPEELNEIPSFMKEKLAQFYQREQEAEQSGETTPQKTFSRADQVLTSLEQIWEKTASGTGAFFRTLSLRQRSARLVQASSRAFTKGKLFFCSLSLQQKRFIVGGTAALIVIALGIPFLLQSSWWNTSKTPETTSNTETGSSPTPASNTTSSDDATVLLNHTDSPLVTSVVLNDETYAVTEKSIVAVAQNKTFALPTGNDALYAAAMDDLRLIFVYTRNSRLYAFSPISKTFVENTLTLPEGSQVTGMGTYLTYLYVLDSNHDQIYRFPRADGGFGTGASWLKDTVSIEENTLFAVNESLFLTPAPTSAQGFFRGRQNVTLEAPADGMTIESLYTFPDLTQVYALDREHGRLLVWNQEGKLLETYENKAFSEGQSLSVSEKTSEAFIGTEDSLLSFKLK